MSGRRGTDPVLVAGAAVAAFTGAVLAVALLGATRDVDRPVFLAVLVGAAVLLAVLAAATLTARPESPRPAAAGPAPKRNAAPPGPEWRAAPAEPAESTGQWWSTPAPAAPHAAPRPSTSDGAMVPDLDLPEPRAGTRIVTCPRCNGERVDLRHAGDAFALDCTECRHQWSWAPGSPWPVTVVRPRLRPAAPR